MLGIRRSGVRLALAASVAFLAAVAGLARVARERDALRAELRSTTAAYTAQLDSARVALASGRRIVDALTGPEVKVVDLTAAGARPPVARMFWDRATNRWTMFAHHLPPPAAGRTYQLWLVTRDAKKISAGTFAPTPAGDALVSAEYPLAPTALQAVAVTEEPAGGVPQPTGPMVLVGTAGR